MIETQTKTEGDLAGVLSLAKQIRFAVAWANTLTVKDAQQKVIQTIQDTFITRNPWFAPSNYYGIHYKQATIEDPSTELSTNAYWLVPHEEGALKRPNEGQFLAIPTAAIQPDIRTQVPRSQLPRNLQNAFILNTKRGPKLFQRLNGRLREVYNLVEQVRVRKQSTVIEPTVETFRNNFLPNLAKTLEEAIRTAK